MNQLDVPNVGYTNASVLGYLRIASAPRHFVFTHAISNSSKSVRITIGGSAINELTNVTWLIPDYAVRMTNSANVGWVFIVYDVINTVTRLFYSSATGLVATRDTSTGSALEINLLAVASTISPEDLKIYLYPNRVQITSRQLDKDGIIITTLAEMNAQWNILLGVFVIPIRSLTSGGGTPGVTFDSAPSNYAYHNLYNRFKITINNTALSSVTLPLCFHDLGGTLTMSITSGIAMFRDANGEPLGIQIQMSKNWHSATEKWYHLYSNPMLAGPGIDTMELTVAMSRWGQAHAAQHSQLSLIGWTSSRQGGQWQESSISPVGESITYDPDQTLNRAMIDDVRPFLSLGTINVNSKWQWTGNIRGADFLVYVATGTTIKRKLGRVRTNYEAHGPTITNVGFDAISYLDEIQSNIKSSIGQLQ